MLLVLYMKILLLVLTSAGFQIGHLCSVQNSLENLSTNQATQKCSRLVAKDASVYFNVG